MFPRAAWGDTSEVSLHDAGASQIIDPVCQAALDHSGAHSVYGLSSSNLLRPGH